MNTGWDIRYFTSTSCERPPSLIYDIPRHRIIFSRVSPCYLTPKACMITKRISFLSCIEASIFYVQMWIHIFPVWPPPFSILRDIGVCYHWQRPPWVHPAKHLVHNVILLSHITYIGLFTMCYHIAYFRWISPVKIAIMTSCLLRSRDVKVMKSMMSCR